jgi:hypothetical protein
MARIAFPEHPCITLNGDPLALIEFNLVSVDFEELHVRRVDLRAGA